MQQTLAIKLLKENKAFLCICTHEEHLKNNNIDKEYLENYSGMCIDAPYDIEALKKEKTPFVIRIKQPDAPLSYYDLIQGDIQTPPNEVDAFVILNADGTPTYNFASACGDMLSGVTMVIQDETHLNNTAKQIHIQNQLGYEQETHYAHLPMMLNTDDTYSVKWLFEQGFIPDAIINYLLLLSSDNAPQEIFTLPEAIAWFELENISKKHVTFDIDRLRFINREHLKRIEDKQLSTLFGFADADIGKLAKLYLEEVSTVRELEAKIKPIFSPKNFEDAWTKEMRTLEALIQDAPMFSKFEDFKTYIIKESGLKEREFTQALRLLLTGAEDGPELSHIYPFIKAYLLEVAS